MTGQQQIALLVSDIKGTLRCCRERLSDSDVMGEEEQYMQDCDDALADLVKLGQITTRAITLLNEVMVSGTWHGDGKFVVEPELTEPVDQSFALLGQLSRGEEVSV